MPQVTKDRVALPLEDAGKAEASPTSGRPEGRGLWWRRLLLAGLLLGLGLAGGMYLRPLLSPLIPGLAESGSLQSSVAPEAEHQPPSDAQAADVVALGRLVPDGGVLAVALPSGAGDARIARLMVVEGQQVAAGETVAELDNMPAFLAARASAESNLEAQKAALEQVRASILASLAESRADQLSAEAALTLAKQELERQTKLAASASTTQVLIEQARANVAKAQAELDRAVAFVKRYRGAATGSQADIVLAARNLDLARTNLARANADIAAGRVVAPRAGTVLEIHARVGEKPTGSGAMTIGDLTQMMAELEVYQTDIKKVAPGQTVTMTAQALPAPLTGRVAGIRQIVGRQSVMSTEPAANADARIVRISVALDAGSSLQARSFTNLEVVGRIGTQTE